MRRWIWWDFPRASWQYDVIVVAILAFVFLTPRAWFRDQPRPRHVAMLPAEQGANVYWVEPELLAGVPAELQPERAAALLRPRPRAVLRVEPIYDAEREVRGYLAYAKP